MPLSNSPIQSLPRTLLSLLALNLLSSPAHAGFILYGHSTAIPNILTLPVAQTCPVSVDGLTSTNFPWTHNPTCIGQYCVYSSSRFANDRGISLIATPELATSYLLESFSHDDQSDDLHGDTTPDYVADDTPDKGIGLFARRAIPAGKTIMVKHPVILLPKELADGDRDVTEQRARLLEIAIRQLPRKTTEMLKGLSTNMGGLRLDDLVRTNAMGVVLGNGGGEGTGYLGVVPEAARINHACRPK
ncbi:hypothetical protein BU24DRAFT_282931 [Aaosphaeria arxii CBS 175.79]|uniref:Uncharacterized protein n=1 Tax=Aaosphaeria arxii CBS 175.79 TaxID=1450172 RepID=A0A6A5XF21_9PLEO|nr:uncharacterized protein BU24DRAFT_282931 [Aaosphaeria arxii CBS 175.79]KAF2011520.1 hypothetical protein BU24DRAFT_282931 [Aaosphaeria arxii CBS 175.79]